MEFILIKSNLQQQHKTCTSGYGGSYKGEKDLPGEMKVIIIRLGVSKAFE